MKLPLPGPTIPTRSDGVCAEHYPDGSLKHLGCYRDGRPVGWFLDLAWDRPQGTLSKQESYNEENSSVPFSQWVEDWAQVIFEESDFVRRCSFCGKSDREVRKLIAGPTSMICDECVQLCQEILATEVV